jgi:D-alanyl-D-alanine carboxypeptidase (penicillin-binding protein 5/6)
MLRPWGVLTALFVCVGPLQAQDAALPAPPRIAAASYYLVDFASGHVLAQSAAERRVPPASLTKLMTAYAVFKALEEGRISVDDEVHVSEKAWRMGGTRMFIEVNSRVPVEALIRGMLIQSGNDASVALAEHVAGSVDAFVALMNAYAEALGMSDTAYRNPTGLPAREHYSSAHDLAILARALIAEFPDYYGLYAEREFTYNGIKQHNRNRLLWRDSSVDGLKTGHTNAAGYCLVTSAQRDGMRLIAVILGADSANARTAAGQKLLDYGFQSYETHKLYSAGQEISTARVWGGQPEVTALGLATDLFVTIPRGLYESLNASMDLRTDLAAPLDAGSAVGEVKVLLQGLEISRVPLVVLQQVADGGAWARLRDEVSLWLE